MHPFCSISSAKTSHTAQLGKAGEQMAYLGSTTDSAAGYFVRRVGRAENS